jgi:hypothetical protein
MGQGLEKDGLERFAAVAASHVGQDEVPGLVAPVAHGGEVRVEAIGTLAIGTVIHRPVRRWPCDNARAPLTCSDPRPKLCPRGDSLLPHTPVSLISDGPHGGSQTLLHSHCR